MPTFHIVQNSEGKKISVTPEAFNELKHMYLSGYFSAIIKDVKGKTHAVLIDQEALKS